MKTKTHDGIKEIKGKQGLRWVAYKKGRIIAGSEGDGYRNRKDMINAMISLKDQLNDFITEELLKQSPVHTGNK